MTRAFLGALIPEDVLERVTTIHREVTESIGRQGVRAVDPAKLHLTLEFLGNVDEDDFPLLEKRMREVALKHGPIPVTIGDLGAFPGLERPATVWLGVDGGSDLEAIQLDVAVARDGIGTHFDKKAYVPHITLARVSPPSRKVGAALRPHVDRLRDQVLGTMLLEEIVLLKSTPEAYEMLSAFPLGV